MGGDEERDPLLVQVRELLHHVPAALGIEVPYRLICEE